MRNFKAKFVWIFQNGFKKMIRLHDANIKLILKQILMIQFCLNYSHLLRAKVNFSLKQTKYIHYVCIHVHIQMQKKLKYKLYLHSLVI